MNPALIIEEKDTVEYDNRSELSYFDVGLSHIELFVDDDFVGYLKVFRDSEMNDREYVCINYEIIYLDTLKKVDGNLDN